MNRRILINAKWRTSASVTGVQRYAEGLSRAIEASELDATWAEPPQPGRFRTTIWEQRTLPKLARDADVLLCPANMAPPRTPEGTKLVVVIHCLRYRVHPTSYPSAFVRWYERMIPRIIERADRVLTVSHAELNEITTIYPQAHGKLGVLPPGLDPHFRPGLDRDPSAPEGAYLIALSNGSPAKNLATVLNALAIDPSLPPLVVAGITENEADAMCPHPIRDRVIPLGHINDPARVAALVANASALLSPSRYESFGYPCLEAMGCATPVIASDLPAHQELCQDAAILINPDDPHAWADTIRSLCDAPEHQVRLARAGLERARSFTWAHSLDALRAELAMLDFRVPV